MENLDIKQKIIDAALKLFNQISYSKTSVSDIAKLAGVGKGTIYLYFKTKEDILSVIIESVIEDIKHQNANFFLDPSIPQSEKIYKFLDLWIEQIIIVKDLLFGSFEEVNVRMVKDIFIKYNTHRPAVEYITSFFETMTIKNNSFETSQEFIHEFVNLIIGRIILFFLEEDWDTFNINQLQRIIKNDAKILLKNIK